MAGPSPSPASASSVGLFARTPTWPSAGRLRKRLPPLSPSLSFPNTLLTHTLSLDLAVGGALEEELDRRREQLQLHLRRRKHALSFSVYAYVSVTVLVSLHTQQTHSLPVHL